MGGAYGGCAKGIPKNLVKLPLAEPMKFFELSDASVSIQWKSQGSITNRIIQSDHRSLVAYTKSGATKGKRDQTQPSEHGVAPRACRREWGGCACIPLGVRIYGFKSIALESDGENKFVRDKR
jgi:hypothetical protein